MIHKIVVFILLMSVALTGCGANLPVQTAGLTVLTANEDKQWGIPDRLIKEGDGNSYRVLSSSTPNQHMLELVAGHQGQMEYFVEEQADMAAFAEFRLQFLSTQGRGQVKLSALDSQGKTVGEVGFVFTGELPKNTLQSKWQDLRYTTNYQGNWIEQRHNFSEIVGSLSQETMRSAVKYRLSVTVGQGQHVLITKLAIQTDLGKAVRVMPETLKYTVGQGDQLSIGADVQNVSSKQMNQIAVKLIEPYGYGLTSMNPLIQMIGNLAPGEKRRISWQVQAQRSDAVNLNKPWTVKFSVNDQESQDQVKVSIVDRKPGKIFYVMTEDLEPIDSAGYPVAWGNGNSWLDPEEFLGQMVNKSEALNGIAERYGAKWTHYIAWPAVKAAQWADGQSQTGQWSKVVLAIQGSVTQGANNGHEYGIHLHSDYDPYLPGNVLSYNGAVDGIWANHLKHGWAHSISTEGNFNDYTSRTGMLYAYQRILDELSRNSDQGQLLTARVGSFDFGSGNTDEAMSTTVYKKVGLWGSSDADGNNGGAVTTGDYGREIYLAAPDDINKPTEDLKKVGVVEFRPTPRQSITYDNQSARVMNEKTDQGMEYFTAGKMGVNPGIHAVIGFTHAMFVMGDGDWKSLEGGQFQNIDQHLAYVKEKYVDQGLLHFGTANELVEAYLDYYTPELLAIYGKLLSDERGIAQYAIRIVGSDILVDEAHSHQVSIKYPLYLRDSAYRISVLKNGQPVYNTWGLPTPFNDINFVIDDREGIYTLKIYHNELIHRMITRLQGIKLRISKLFK